MPLVGWVHLIQGDVEQAVDWLQKSFENQISQVLNTRAFAQILDGGERNRLAHPLLQDFLSQMNLDDRAISKYCDSGLFQDQF